MVREQLQKLRWEKLSIRFDSTIDRVSSGAVLEIVTDKSQEGSQFVRGFGGVGGILRYKVDLQNLNVDEDAEPIDYSKRRNSMFPSFSTRLFSSFLGDYDY